MASIILLQAAFIQLANWVLLIYQAWAFKSNGITRLYNDAHSERETILAAAVYYVSMSCDLLWFLSPGNCQCEKCLYIEQPEHKSLNFKY